MKRFIVSFLMLVIGGVFGQEERHNPFVIEKKEVEKELSERGITIYELLQEYVDVAKTYARPQITGYHVGIAALGESGNIYLGVNLEFAGLPLNEAVHGEQFMLTNARYHKERSLLAIALSAAPCGHCRQFLNEMGNADSLLIITPGAPIRTLAALLPEAFGPKDLGLEPSLMAQKPSSSKHSLEENAVEAAMRSHAPYSHSKSGVAILTKTGSIYTGSYLENVAFNPSLAPLQAALVALVQGQEAYEDITHVILAEEKSCMISQKGVTEHIVDTLCPKAIFETVEYLPTKH